MYIITDGKTYENVRVLSSGSSIHFIGESLPDVAPLTQPIVVYADNGFEMQRCNPEDYIRQVRTAGSWLLTNIPEPVDPGAQQVEYDLLESTANMVKLLMADQKPQSDDEKIMVSALWDEWAAGNHTAGEVYTVGGEPWECYQSYDNAMNPDIRPGQSAWQTFNRPLHGTSRETARYFVQPTGSHDMYKAGEWMIFDKAYYECLQDTNYSPADYPQAWEKKE